MDLLVGQLWALCLITPDTELLFLHKKHTLNLKRTFTLRYSVRIEETPGPELARSMQDICINKHQQAETHSWLIKLQRA